MCPVSESKPWHRDPSKLDEKIAKIRNVESVLLLMGNGKLRRI